MWPRRRFAIEVAAGLGQGIAQLPAAPANTSWTSRPPHRPGLRAGHRGTRKTDAADAASVAHAAVGRLSRSVVLQLVAWWCRRAGSTSGTANLGL